MSNAPRTSNRVAKFAPRKHSNLKIIFALENAFKFVDLMAGIEDIQTQKSFKYLEEVETLAQDILLLKETKLNIANAQNKFREGLRALENTEDRRTWMQVGKVFVERPTEECKIILRQEIGKAEDDLKDLHEKIKYSVYKLRDLEHEPRLEGFTLKPISSAEAKALHKGLGLV